MDDPTWTARMDETTWGDIEKEYIEAEEWAHGAGLQVHGNQYVAEMEYEDDWVRLVDVRKAAIKLESAIEACRLYLKTGTPFARAALERALEELE